MKAVAFFLDGASARNTQQKLEEKGIPSTIINIKVDDSGAPGYRLMVEEFYSEDAEAILQEGYAAVISTAEMILKERFAATEEGRIAQAKADTEAKKRENLFWYGFTALVVFLLIAYSLRH